MKEPEYSRTSDGKSYMDASVISDIPFKVTIIDPRPFLVGFQSALMMLPCISEVGYSETALSHLTRTIVITCMQGIVNRRKAWVHGDDADVEIHLMNLRELIGFDIPAELREEIRYDLGGNPKAADKLDMLLKQLRDMMVSNMNPNKFTLHRLTQSPDLRTVMIEEYADWRVIQWTAAEQDKIADRHEDI